MTRNSIEITELTIGDAHICRIHVTIYLPGNFSVRNLFFSQLISNKHQLSKGSMLKKELAFFSRKKLELKGTVV